MENTRAALVKTAEIKPRRKKYNIPIFVILMIGAVAMIFPFVWMILSSFKTTSDIYTYPPKWLPSTFNWQNYSAVFKLIPFARYYVNSIFTSVMQTFIQIALSIFGAYAIVFLDMYLIMNSLQDTYAGIILPQVFSAFTIFLILSFFESIPRDLCDSAKLDGCGYFKIMFHVVIPNAKSSISTAAMFAFLGHWKSYTWPLIITNKDKYRTLPIGMKYLVAESSKEYQVMMAASVMAIIWQSCPS